MTIRITKEWAEAVAKDPVEHPLNFPELRELARLAALYLGESYVGRYHVVLDEVDAPDASGVDARIKALASQRDTARNTLPHDVREALQCAADYGPMGTYEWMDKWSIPRGCGDWDDRLAAKCAAALAAHPDVAPMVPPFDGDPKECAFPKVDTVQPELAALRDDLARSNAAVTTWKGRAEWLLAELRGGGQ